MPGWKRSRGVSVFLAKGELLVCSKADILGESKTKAEAPEKRDELMKLMTLLSPEPEPAKLGTYRKWSQPKGS